MKFDLEDRLIDFAVLVLTLVESLPDSRGCNHLAGQLIRSGTAPALLYAEASGAQSTGDFIHKMSLCLKELRESSVCQRIIQRKGYKSDTKLLAKALSENKELIAIFGSSINTAKKNAKLR
jgi:four helix bundle protein